MMVMGTERMWQVRYIESLLFLAISLLPYRSYSLFGCDFKIVMPHLLDVCVFIFFPF
jgi:hypothetical protein